MKRITCLLILQLCCLSLYASDIGLPPGERPVKLRAAMYIADLDAINTSEQSFEARIFYRVYWYDKRLAHNSSGPINKMLSEIWHPSIQILNQQKVWKSTQDLARIDPDGKVTMGQGLWGSFSQPMKLKTFPFDTQKFSLILVTGRFSPDKVKLVPDESDISGIAKTLSVADWKIMKWEEEIKPFEMKNLGERTSISFSFTAKRLTSYFIVKMILPLVMIVMMSWAVFWMDPLNVASNVGISITSMLTLIAYRFSADALLPRLSYLTSLDYFILASTILVFLSLAQNLTTSSLAKKGKMKQSHNLDVACRIGFPLVFLIIILETMVFRWFL